MRCKVRSHFPQSALDCWVTEMGPPRAQHPPALLSCRYEDEINKRTAAENEFVVLKKVSQGQIKVGKPWTRGQWEKWGVLAPWHSVMLQN